MSFILPSLEIVPVILAPASFPSFPGSFSLVSVLVILCLLHLTRWLSFPSLSSVPLGEVPPTPTSPPTPLPFGFQLDSSCGRHGQETMEEKVDWGFSSPSALHRGTMIWLYPSTTTAPAQRPLLQGSSTLWTLVTLFPAIALSDLGDGSGCLLWSVSWGCAAL